MQTDLKAAALPDCKLLRMRECAGVSATYFGQQI